LEVFILEIVELMSYWSFKSGSSLSEAADYLVSMLDVL